MRHSHDLLRFLTRRVGFQDAPDLLQETYLRVLRHAERETIDDPGAFLHATRLISPRTICAAAGPSKNTWNSAISPKTCPRPIFKPQVRAIVQLFSAVREEPKDLKSTLIPGEPPLGLAAAAADKYSRTESFIRSCFRRRRRASTSSTSRLMTSRTGLTRIGMPPSINTVGSAACAGPREIHGWRNVPRMTVPAALRRSLWQHRPGVYFADGLRAADPLRDRVPPLAAEAAGAEEVAAT